MRAADSLTTKAGTDLAQDYTSADTPMEAGDVSPLMLPPQLGSRSPAVLMTKL